MCDRCCPGAAARRYLYIGNESSDGPKPAEADWWTRPARRRRPCAFLIAYACWPEHGSEPAIGWGWATSLADIGHDVTVLTILGDGQDARDHGQS